ncbi:uncharacterized protein LOC134650792 [Cydia amplana]|uniref:uncharacterized protein LOC134650792 n=1 Tax=Cydia amplana TaxID=1869771 RepID=UPI002FE56727
MFTNNFRSFVDLATLTLHRRHEMEGRISVLAGKCDQAINNIRKLKAQTRTFVNHLNCEPSELKERFLSCMNKLDEYIYLITEFNLSIDNLEKHGSVEIAPVHDNSYKNYPVMTPTNLMDVLSEPAPTTSTACANMCPAEKEKLPIRRRPKREQLLIAFSSTSCSNESVGNNTVEKEVQCVAADIQDLNIAEQLLIACSSTSCSNESVGNNTVEKEVQCVAADIQDLNIAEQLLIACSSTSCSNESVGNNTVEKEVQCGVADIQDLNIAEQLLIACSSTSCSNESVGNNTVEKEVQCVAADIQDLNIAEQLLIACSSTCSNESVGNNTVEKEVQCVAADIQDLNIAEQLLIACSSTSCFNESVGNNTVEKEVQCVAADIQDLNIAEQLLIACSSTSCSNESVGNNTVEKEVQCVAADIQDLNIAGPRREQLLIACSSTSCSNESVGNNTVEKEVQCVAADIQDLNIADPKPMVTLPQQTILDTDTVYEASILSVDGSTFWIVVEQAEAYNLLQEMTAYYSEEKNLVPVNLDELPSFTCCVYHDVEDTQEFFRAMLIRVEGRGKAISSLLQEMTAYYSEEKNLVCVNLDELPGFTCCVYHDVEDTQEFFRAMLIRVEGRGKAMFSLLQEMTAYYSEEKNLVSVNLDELPGFTCCVYHDAEDTQEFFRAMLIRVEGRGKAISSLLQEMTAYYSEEKNLVCVNLDELPSFTCCVYHDAEDTQEFFRAMLIRVEGRGKAISSLLQDMTAYYSEEKNLVPVNLDDLPSFTCCVYHDVEDTQEFFRAMLIRVEGTNKEEVFLVDTGEQRPVTSSCIQPLAPEFCVSPPYAHCCHLADDYSRECLVDTDEQRPVTSSCIQPLAPEFCISPPYAHCCHLADVEFVSAKTDELEEYLKQYLGKPFTMKIDDNSSESLGVYLFLDDENTLNDLLLQEGLATTLDKPARTEQSSAPARGPPELRSSSEHYYSGPEHENPVEAVTGYNNRDELDICKHYTGGSEKTCFKGSRCKKRHVMKHPDGWTLDRVPTPKCRPPVLPAPGTWHKVVVTYVCHFDRLYVMFQREPPKEELPTFGVVLPPMTLAALIRDMNSPATRAAHKPLQTAPAPGELVAAQYRDRQWYRARVICATPPDQNVEVMYIDYGNVLSVKENEVMELEPRFTVLPAQAVLCRLAGVDKLSEDRRTWVTAKQRLSSLAQDQTMEAHIIARGYDELTVELLDLQGFNLAEQLAAGGAVTYTRDYGLEDDSKRRYHLVQA